MCGIFGRIDITGEPVDKKVIAALGELNDYRGGDACGIFMQQDKHIEYDYGIESNVLFIDHIKNSLVFKNIVNPNLLLCHCRKASVGSKTIKEAQPVVLCDNNDNVKIALLHNGTIKNIDTLVKKFIPNYESATAGLTDSWKMGYILYYSDKYEEIFKEYDGSASLVWHNYKTQKTYIWRGESKKYKSGELTEERPLHWCIKDGQIWFNSEKKLFQSLFYTDKIESVPANTLHIIDDKLNIETIKIDREGTFQEYTTYQRAIWEDDEDSVYGSWKKKTKIEWDVINTNIFIDNIKAYKNHFGGKLYRDRNDKLINGHIWSSLYGYEGSTHNTNIYNEYWFVNGYYVRGLTGYEALESMSRATGISMDKIIDDRLAARAFVAEPYLDNDGLYYKYDFKIQDGRLIVMSDLYNGIFTPLFTYPKWKYRIENGKITGRYKCSYHSDDAELKFVDVTCDYVSDEIMKDYCKDYVGTETNT